MGDNVVITIARQYGSGGKTIGTMLGEKLGIPVYNREILRLASEDSGINEAMFNQVDEKLGKSTGQTLMRLIRRSLKDVPSTPESDDFLSDQNLFNFQAKIIRKLAETESCVIIGRCADYILREYDNAVSVFVHASPEYCRRQAIERGAISMKDVDKFIQKTDRFRADYYKYYTGHDWTNAQNYDLCLNSERIGFEGCVDAICAYMKVRFGDGFSLC